MSRRGREPRIVVGAPAVAAQRPLASGLTVVGTALVLLGPLRALLVLDVLPEQVGAAVDRWWPALLVVAGVWLATSGRRVTGVAVGLLGLLLLGSRVLPDGTFLPALLIVVGLALLFGATGGRRWLLGGGAIALFDDVRTGGSGAPAARSYVAVFGDARGRLEPTLAEEGPVECLAVFGDVQVQVPADTAVVLSETAVFGDVQAPQPPVGPVTGTVLVRATAVFGEVQLIRE